MSSAVRAVQNAEFCASLGLWVLAGRGGGYRCPGAAARGASWGHGRRRSSSAAMERIKFSLPAGATIWTPTGSPLAGAGTEIAGSPARFHGVMHSQLPMLRAVGNQPLPAQVPIGTAGLASVGVIRASKPLIQRAAGPANRSAKA